PSPARQKTKRTTCLQAPCADNQRFFKSSEEAELFAGLCLVFNIFFQNFKIAFSLSYKQKTYYSLKNALCGWPAQESNPKNSNYRNFPSLTLILKIFN